MPCGKANASHVVDLSNKRKQWPIGGGCIFTFLLFFFFCHSLIYKKLSENFGTYTCPSLWCFSSSLLVTVVFKLKVTETGFLIRNKHFATYPELTGKRQSLPVQKYSLGKQLMWMVKKGGKMVENSLGKWQKIAFHFPKTDILVRHFQKAIYFLPTHPQNSEGSIHLKLTC